MMGQQRLRCSIGRDSNSWPWLIHILVNQQRRARETSINSNAPIVFANTNHRYQFEKQGTEEEKQNWENITKKEYWKCSFRTKL